MADSARLGTRLYSAVVTPLKPNEEVDEVALREYLRYFLQPRFIEAGGGIIINPEAGDAFYLTREEKRRNMEIAMEECGGKLPVFAGITDATTAGSVACARDAKECGVDGLFLMPPIGALDVTSAWDPERCPEVWLDFAKAQVDAAGGMPAITHPYTPWQRRAGARGLPPSATVRMCTEIPSIVGWKMIYDYDGFKIVAKTLRQLPRQVGILCCSAHLFHEYLACGYFDGTLTGSFNYGMERMLDHIDAWKANDVVKAREIWDGGLRDLHQYVYQMHDMGYRLHVRYKTATWLRGLIPSPFMRAPMPRPRKEEVLTLRKLLTAVGYEVISEAAMNQVVDCLPL